MKKNLLLLILFVFQTISSQENYDSFQEFIVSNTVLSSLSEISTDGYYEKNDGGASNYIIIDSNTTNLTTIDIKVKDKFYARPILLNVLGKELINVRAIGVKAIESLKDLAENGQSYPHLEDNYPSSGYSYPMQVSIDNIILLQKLSVFIQGNLTQNFKISFNKNGINKNIFPIANSWGLKRGNLDIEIQKDVMLYGDITGNFNDAGLMTSSTGTTIVFSSLLVDEPNQILNTYTDFYIEKSISKIPGLKSHAEKLRPTDDGSTLIPQFIIDNLKIYGEGTVSNFGRILKETVNTGSSSTGSGQNHTFKS